MSQNRVGARHGLTALTCAIVLAERPRARAAFGRRAAATAAMLEEHAALHNVAALVARGAAMEEVGARVAELAAGLLGSEVGLVPLGAARDRDRGEIVLHTNTNTAPAGRRRSQRGSRPLPRFSERNFSRPLRARQPAADSDRGSAGQRPVRLQPAACQCRSASHEWIVNVAVRGVDSVSETLTSPSSVV